MIKLICKFIVERSHLYLGHKPSVLGATSTILALNICKSPVITEALDLELL